MSSNHSPRGGVITRSCQRCRMSLPPNEARCGNCGFMNVSGPGSGAAGGPISQVLSGQSQAGGGLWVPPEEGPAAGGMSGNAGQGGPGRLHMPSQLSQPGFGSSIRPSMGGGAFFNKDKGSATLSTILRRDFFQNQRPAARMRMMMGVIVLIIMIISGSIIGIVYFSAKSAPDTQTVVPIPTPAIPPTFSDPFNDNSYGWNLQSEVGKYSVQIGGGNLTLEDDNHKLFWEPLPGQRSYDDFKLFVDATLSKGDAGNGYGVYIRGASGANNDLATYYRFALYGDGGYAIFRGDRTGTPTKLVDWTSSTAINQAGKVNHMLITAQGSSLTLTVNGHELKTINDPSYTKGTVAFFVSNVTDASAGAQAQFSNFGIYSLKA